MPKSLRCIYSFRFAPQQIQFDSAFILAKFCFMWFESRHMPEEPRKDLIFWWVTFENITKRKAERQ